MKGHQYPQGHIFYRHMGKDHPLIVGGKGVYLYDAAGKRYLDGSGGAVVVNAGHGVETIASAIAEQAGRAAYLHANTFTSQVLEDYAERLAGIVPLPEARFYFLTTGSEATEAALKLARQIQLERGQASRFITISRQMSYHGLSLGALAVSGREKMRAPFLPMFQDVPHIPPPYCYRCPLGLESKTCQLACAGALEEEILRQGPDRVSAFIAEPISGATLGAVLPPEGYWKAIREICDRYGVLLIADEVMTGMGRTGKWFAVEHWGLVPDLITIGKGATSGYFPLSILAAKKEHLDLIARGSGDFNHGGTFSHHAVGAAAGLATLEYLEKHQLVQRAAELGPFLSQELGRVFGQQPWTGDIRGRGLMWAIEFVEDKNTRQPIDPRHRFSYQVADQALERGLIVYPGSGSAGESGGDHLMFAPPFTITKEQIQDALEMLFGAIQDVYQRIG
jgi:adenosylmethionine-8-amino-7-oxononanoate aminotransferase